VGGARYRHHPRGRHGAPLARSGWLQPDMHDNILCGREPAATTSYGCGWRSWVRENMMRTQGNLSQFWILINPMIFTRTRRDLVERIHRAVRTYIHTS
jgi:hypothetical protein